MSIGACPSGLTRVGFLLLFFVLAACATPAPVKLTDERLQQLAQDARPVETAPAQRGPGLVVRGYEAPVETETPPAAAPPPVVAKAPAPAEALSPAPPAALPAPAPAPGRAELLQRVPEPSRESVDKIALAEGRLRYTLRYVVPKGASFSQTLQRLKEIGFAEEEIHPHIQTVTPEKLTDKYKMRFAPSTPMGMRYFRAGDVLEAARDVPY